MGRSSVSIAPIKINKDLQTLSPRDHGFSPESGYKFKAIVERTRTPDKGKNMAVTQELLAAAIASIVSKKEERAVANLFARGSTHTMKGEFAGTQ